MPLRLCCKKNFIYQNDRPTNSFVKCTKLVTVTPGLTELQRTFFNANSKATQRVNWSTAALEML